jgi:hypothetical protein
MGTDVVVLLSSLGTFLAQDEAVMGQNSSHNSSGCGEIPQAAETRFQAATVPLKKWSLPRYCRYVYADNDTAVCVSRRYLGIRASVSLSHK